MVPTFGTSASGCRQELSARRAGNSWLGFLWVPHLPILDNQGNKRRAYGKTQLLCWGLWRKRTMWFSGSLWITLTGPTELWLLFQASQYLAQTVSIWGFCIIAHISDVLTSLRRLSSIFLVVELKTWLILCYGRKCSFVVERQCILNLFGHPGLNRVFSICRPFYVWWTISVQK